MPKAKAELIEVAESYGRCTKCGRRALLGDRLCVRCWDGTFHTCKYCHSAEVVKVGRYDGEQKWRCNTCGHKFYFPSRRIKAKYDREVQDFVLTMRGTGLSYRKLRVLVGDRYGRYPSLWSVCAWVHKFEGVSPAERKR